MLTTEPPAPASALASADFVVHAVALKLPEFWADNAQVWFAQTETQFAIKGVTSSLTKFYYCVKALGRSDAKQIVPFKRVALQVPQGDPHQATHPQPFPKVPGFHVSHLGH